MDENAKREYLEKLDRRILTELVVSVIIVAASLSVGIWIICK